MPTLQQPPPIRYLAGLDVGQVSDPTALVIAEREMRLHQGKLKPWFLVRYIERVPLGTPYPVMVSGVRERLLALDGRFTLVIDHTGVGRPVFDLFAETGPYSLGKGLSPVGVSITHGQTVTQVEGRWHEWHVGKGVLVMGLQVALQEGRFQVARGLPEAPTLVKEAQNFQWKVTAHLHDQYGAWREGQHDDILLASAVLVWYGTLYAPTQWQGEGVIRKAIATGNPLFLKRPIRRVG